MTDKELHKLRRSELLEIMLNLKMESDRLKQENEELRLTLNERNVSLEKSGNIAEAALQLSGIFEKAQQAADIYLTSVEKTYQQKDKIISDAEAKAAKIISDAEKYAGEIRRQAEKETAKT